MNRFHHHTGILAWLLWMTVTLVARENPSLSNAVPRYNLVIPVPTALPHYGWTTPNTRYDYVGRSPLGHEVLLETASGTVVARIPFRDEWGRVSVDSSEFDIRIAPGTVNARIPVPLSSGAVILYRDQPYPAFRDEDGRIIVQYTLRNFTTNLPVAESNVRFPVVPATNDIPSTNPAITFTTAEPVPPAATPVVADVATPTPPTETPVVVPEPAPVPAPTAKPLAGRRNHAGIGATVTVSSTHATEANEGPPDALVDGMLTTRWSSEYTEPQHVILTFPKPIPARQINLFWETASAVRYAISTSIDGTTWQAQPPVTKQVPAEPRTDEIPLTRTPITAIRIDLLTRINPNWGFSLYEVEVLE